MKMVEVSYREEVVVVVVAVFQGIKMMELSLKVETEVVVVKVAELEAPQIDVVVVTEMEPPQEVEVELHSLVEEVAMVFAVAG